MKAEFRELSGNLKFYFDQLMVQYSGRDDGVSFSCASNDKDVAIIGWDGLWVSFNRANRSDEVLVNGKRFVDTLSMEGGVSWAKRIVGKY